MGKLQRGHALVLVLLAVAVLVALVWQHACRFADGPRGSGASERSEGEQRVSGVVGTEGDEVTSAFEGGLSELLDGEAGDGTLPDVVSQLVADGELAVTVEEGDVAQVAQRLLEAYQGQGGCALEQAGYLDLLGSVWGCVVTGGRWVDVCLVSEAGSGSSRLTVLHLDASKVAGELVEGDASDGGES